jgi:dTDP-glucose pyrophosphorylase
MNLERIKNFPKAEKLPEPVKNAAADSTVETKTIEVEEKPKEKKKEIVVTYVYFISTSGKL